ncbi:MAG: poly-beta-1,6 N-acetyl-D-glucosamine export porin PgaA [Nitrospirota bacterium]
MSFVYLWKGFNNKKQRVYCNIFFVLLVCALLFFPDLLIAQGNDITALHKKAVGLARKRSFQESIRLFKEILADKPDDKRILMDYLSVLAWAGKCRESIEIFEGIEKDIPEYVLREAAKCYRNLKQFSQAIEIYKKILEKDKGSFDAQIGLSYVYADNGQIKEAFLTLEPLIESRPDYLDALFARGYVYEREGEYIRAYQQYEDIIRIEPGNKHAWRAKINTMTAMGAHHVALDLTLDHKDKADMNLIARLRGNIAAEYIRWGKNIQPASPEERWKYTDKGLDILSDQLKKNPDDLRTKYDLMVAWLERSETEKVVEEFERFQSEGRDVPIWVKGTAADAYIHENKPYKGIKLYREMLNKRPKDYSTRLRLFYADTIINDFDEAEKIIKELLVEEKSPQVVKKGLTEINWRKVDVETAAAWLPGYQDRLSEAEKRFRELHEMAPFNGSIHSGLAHIYLWRGWPRKAIREFQWILGHDPEYVGVRIGYIHTLMDLGNYRDAESNLKILLDTYPDNLYVQRLNLRWKVHNQNQLKINSRYNREERGGRDWRADISLTSQPFLYDFRLYAAILKQQTVADSDQHTYSRLSTGLIYSGRYNLSITEKTSIDINTGDDFGSITSIVYSPDDYWQLQWAYNSFSTDIPLRARAVGVTGKSTDMGIVFIPNELNRFSMGVSRLRFSDGNNRSAYSMRYRYKLIPGSSYNNKIEFEGSRSSNSMKERVYFNPEHDISYSITDISEFILYNLYNRGFKQRLYITIGSYNQKDFDPGITGEVRYEHEWKFSEGTNLIYSIAFNRRVFDGEPEQEPTFNIGFVNHF